MPENVTSTPIMAITWTCALLVFEVLAKQQGTLQIEYHQNVSKVCVSHFSKQIVESQTLSTAQSLISKQILVSLK